MKRKTLFQNYKDCLFSNKTVYRSQQRFKSDYHKVHREEANKIALCSDGDQRLQTFNRVTTYPCRTNVFKMCEREMMVVRDLFVKKYVDCRFYGETVLKR